MINQDSSFNDNNNMQDVNIERGIGFVNDIDLNSGSVVQQPRKYSRLTVSSPQADHMNFSTASLFLCFVWGIFAFMASNKVRKFNKMKAYDQAAYYSRNALKYNQSAVACFVILILIIGVPLAISLAVQGNAAKFPNARLFFG